MKRSEMAWQYLCACAADNNAVGFEKCFQMADSFLAYAKKQRKTKAAKPCNHRWGYIVENDSVMPHVFICTLCKETIPMDTNYTMGLPMNEPAKPKAAREIEVTYIAAGGPIVNSIGGDYPVTNKRYLFREVLDAES